MKTRSLAFLSAALLTLAGCTGVHRTGTSRVDAFDAIQVDQMTGNQIDPRPLSRSVLCLNARRETRWITEASHVTVTSVTNLAITPVTNVTVSIATNYQYTVMTNLSALPPGPPIAAAPGDAVGANTPAAPAALGTPPPAVEITNAPAASLPAQLSTNFTLSLANNSSGTVAPSQTTASLQSVRNYNFQLTTVTNNLTVSLLTNRVITADTNLVVTWITNVSVTTLTNITRYPTNYAVAEYFLVSELIPPPDFTLAGGESLILLVDGVRHGFAGAQSGTAYTSRRGFTSTLYRVPPELLVDIANAREVRVRFRGVNNTLERTMSRGSQQHFRDFLLKYFRPESAPAGSEAAGEKSMASSRP